MGTTGDAVEWGRVDWWLGVVSSSPGEAQSHAATWGHDSPSQYPAAGPQSTPWPHPATQQLSPPQPTTTSISWDQSPLPHHPSLLQPGSPSSVLRPYHWGNRSWLGGHPPPSSLLQGCRDACSPPASPIINFHQWPSGAGAARGWPRNTALSPDSKNKYIKILAGGRRMQDGRKKLFYNL